MFSAPAPASSSISRSMPMIGARAPPSASRPGFPSMAQASFRRLAVLENTRWAAVVTVSAVSEGSAAVTAAARTASGSRSSRSGHRAQRGCPSRSRLVMSVSRPQAEQRPSRRAQPPQYQSWPSRDSVRRCFPQPAQTGGEITVAPALRSASSRSPATRGAGDRPLARIPGRAASAPASLRRMALPLATLVTACSAASRVSPGSVPVIRATAVPTGSASTSGTSATVTVSCRPG
jgi:hypothetical protein